MKMKWLVVMITCVAISVCCAPQSALTAPDRTVFPWWYIGTVGSAKLEYITPPDQRGLVRWLRFEVRQYNEAQKVLRRTSIEGRDAKFLYVMRCQVDPEFRDQEYHKYKSSTGDVSAVDTSADYLFRKGVSAYLYLLAQSVAQQGNAPERMILGSTTDGPIPVLEKAWKAEKHPLTGLFVAAAYNDLLVPSTPPDPSFIPTLIRLTAGAKYASAYEAARDKRWDVETPDVSGMTRQEAEGMAAAISNQISCLSFGKGKDRSGDVIVNREGEVIAVYSKADKDYHFPKKGTELWYLGQWRQAIKTRFGIR